VTAIGRDLAVRANRAYRLQSLSTAAALLATELGDGARLLVATPESGLPAKLVDDAGARLFTALSRRPGPVPGELTDEQLTALVLDGVLEAEGARGWVSGPHAFEELIGTVELPEPVDRLGRLSYAAVARAERMSLHREDELTIRLYGAGRFPLSRRWIRAYPGPHAVESLFGAAPMERDWILVARSEWLSYTRRGGAAGVTAADLRYKLYVSPHIDTLPAVLPVMAATLAATGAPHFKVGAGASGLLRPDKIVVYLRDSAELTEVSEALSAALDGVAAHGVPFSAELAGDGLLSWGGDPHAGAGPAGAGPESWRLSVCRRLSEHLAAAKRASLRSLTPARYALARLGADGVTLPSFAPTSLGGLR
jgi:hypothetical protein